MDGLVLWGALTTSDPKVAALGGHGALGNPGISEGDILLGPASSFQYAVPENVTAQTASLFRIPMPLN